VYCKLFSIVSFLFLEIKQCVLSPPSVSKPPPVVSPTNNWYQSPVRQKTEVFLGDIWIFKVVKNTFWSFHRVELIHTNSLAQQSTWSDTEVAHTLHLKILHCLTTRSRRAQRLKTSAVHARHILSRLSRAEPSCAPSLLQRRRIFSRIFPFQA